MSDKAKGSKGGDDHIRDRAIYYLGCAAIISACLAFGTELQKEQWSDELPDFLEPWKLWHEQFVMKKFRWMGWLAALGACRKFRKNYHTKTTPLHSFVWGYMSFNAGIMASDIFMGQPVAVFKNTDANLRYAVVWALLNLDPTDALWKFTNNEYFQWVLDLIGKSKGAGLCMKLPSMIEKCDGNKWQGLCSLYLLMTLSDVINALEYKIVTGKSEPTVYSEGGFTWAFTYKVMSIWAYFVSCWGVDVDFVGHVFNTSDVILALHPNLNKDTMFLAITWLNIWSSFAHRLLGCPAEHIAPNELLVQSQTIFSTFKQPVPVLTKSAHVDSTKAGSGVVGMDM